MEIITNHVPRLLLYGYELSASEREDFDYLESELDSEAFIRYRGRVYHEGDFMVTNNPELKDWDGFRPDSYFSGVAIKYVDSDYVIAATIYS